VKNGHGTPFEHAGARFRIEAPIFVLRQLMRHRIASWNEKSLRYTAGPPTFYINPEWDAGMTDATVALCTAASRLYTEALERGTRREVARVLLPVNVMSEVVFSANLRALMLFLSLRNGKHAQVDTRMVAQRIETLLFEPFPLTINVFNECGKKAP
jgi:thymidylate synthase (FAD)